MLEYLYVGMYRFFAYLLHICPKPLRVKSVHVLGRLLYLLSAKHKKRINANLQLAYGDHLDKQERKTIGIGAFENLVDTVFGIVERDGASKEDVIQDVTFEGEEVIQRYLSEGKNFILITGHYGNWELLSQAIAIRFDLPLVGVGRKIDSEKIDAILKRNREQFNVEMIYKKGALKAALQVIREHKVLGILTDQAIRKNQSIDVEFFGHLATHTPLASILSRKFQLDMIPAYISTKDYQNYTVKIYEPIKAFKTDNQEEDLAILTQLQADIMERVIREEPRAWFWMHRRWKGF